MSTKVNLYTTLGCHLCEQALAMLEHCHNRNPAFEICEVEISTSESLMAQYGIRIPVVRTSNAIDEIGWPFTLDELIDYLSLTLDP